MLNDTLKKQLIELHKVCFNDGDYADFFFENRLKEIKAYWIQVEDEVVCACYARFFDLVLLGKRITIPFLTGVATSPKHRYKGYARAIVEKAKKELASEGYPFVLLHPFNHDFYRKLGFETINYVTRLAPTKTAKDGVTFIPMTSEDLPLVSELYDKLISANDSYKLRGIRETKLLIGNSLKHGGFGFLILENGVLKGYVWCEDGNCVEALTEREELLNGLPLPPDYTLPIMNGKSDYSMGAVLSIEQLLKTIPYSQNANGKALFELNGTNFILSVKNGCFHSLTTTLSKGTNLAERELISICLGQGARIENNPFKELIPSYNLACYEIY